MIKKFLILLLNVDNLGIVFVAPIKYNSRLLPFYMSVYRNIYPEFEKMLNSAQKEAILGQKGFALWLYGLSGSGKSTIANSLERRLYAQKIHTKLLDGDNIRSGLNKDLGFSGQDRLENIRRVAEVTKLFVENATICIVSFITPRRSLRELAKEIIGKEKFLEVYVKASYETCAKRDVKGLYSQSNAGQISQFTGKDSPFEEPKEDDQALILSTEADSLEFCVEQLEDFLKKKNL